SPTPVLFISQRHHRIDLHRPAGGHHRRSQGDGGKQQRNHQECQGIGGGHTEQQTLEHTSDSDRGDDAYTSTKNYETCSFEHHQPEHVTSPSAESQAHADLVG